MTSTTATALGCYVVIVNVPGYLPESDPYAVETAEEAVQAVRDEVKRIIDDLPIKRTDRGRFAARVDYDNGGLFAYVDDDSSLGLVVEVAHHEGVTAEEYNAENRY